MPPAHQTAPNTPNRSGVTLFISHSDREIFFEDKVERALRLSRS